MPSKAKFSIKTKKAIYERDNGICIICGSSGVDCHHAKFGTESNYGDDRNEATEGLILCRDCHLEAHAFKRGSGIRQDCINYLLNL